MSTINKLMNAIRTATTGMNAHDIAPLENYLGYLVEAIHGGDMEPCDAYLLAAEAVNVWADDVNAPTATVDTMVDTLVATALRLA